MFSETLDLPGPVIKQIRSANASKLALIARADGNNFVIMAGERFRPFATRTITMKFSDDGQHWPFLVREDGKTRVISDHGISNPYEAVVDWSVHQRGAVLLARKVTRGGCTLVLIATVLLIRRAR